MTKPSFEEKFNALQLGELSDKETVEFYHEFENDIEKKKLILNEIKQQSFFREKLISDNPEHFQQIENDWSIEKIEYLMQSQERAEHTKIEAPKRSKIIMFQLLRVACMLFIAFALFYWMGQEKQNGKETQTNPVSTQTPIATLIHGSQLKIVRKNNNMNHQDGMTLYAKDELVTYALGKAWLQFPDGTRVRVEESTRLQIDRQSVFLKEGALRSKIVKQSINKFQFITPSMNTEILGTIIQLSHLNHNSILDVIKGKVQATRINDNKKIIVNQGERVETSDEFFVIKKIPRELEMTASLVGWWTMSDLYDGKVMDLSGNDNHGLVAGKPQLIDHSGVKGLQYNSIFGDNLIIPDHDSLDFKEKQDLTFLVRFNTTTSKTLALIEKRTPDQKNYPGYVLYMMGGKLGLQLNQDKVTFYRTNGPFVNDGKWHQVIVTVKRSDQARGEFYLDGTLIQEFTPEDTGDLSNNEDLYIGGHTDQANLAYDGLIDEVRIYNRYFSVEDIPDLVKSNK